jgi:hypothetical protein
LEWGKNTGVKENDTSLYVLQARYDAIDKRRRKLRERLPYQESAYRAIAA